MGTSIEVRDIFCIDIVYTYTMDVEKSSEEDFMSLLLQLVREQSKSKMLSGKDKKIHVLNQIRKVLGEEVYHRYEPLLLVSVEFLYKNMVQCKKCLCSTAFPCF